MRTSWLAHPRPMPFGRHGRATVAALMLVAAGAVLSACSSSPTSGAPAGGGVHDSKSSGPTTSTTTTTTTTTVPPQPGWQVLATEPTGVAVDERTVTTPDGVAVTVIRFRAGQVHFDLHDGSQDPPAGTAALPPAGQSTVSATEAPLLLAAFNGGFKVTAKAGGTEVDGQVLTPLVNGMASLVIDSSGGAHIGVWGQPGFPPAGLQVTSVRENLPPLVLNGQPAANTGTLSAWGSTITGLQAVARSGLGQDSAGDLLYAASMSCLPIDIADALTATGAQIGMELDINPYWVQADVAPSPGAPVVAAVPGQNRPADQFQAGWTRDFVTVLAGGPPHA